MEPDTNMVASHKLSERCNFVLSFCCNVELLFLLILIIHLTVMTAVEKVDCHTNHHPYNQSNPCITG